ncbi:hypothetical protein AABB24_020367 [Solanum stoloniferum]|uniref:Uncharacterized protein n=1 Tax=Solanum stoloniferum TaxID=62892 RepID=A0ABD2T7T4_9SOLN
MFSPCHLIRQMNILLPLLCPLSVKLLQPRRRVKRKPYPVHLELSQPRTCTAYGAWIKRSVYHHGLLISRFSMDKLVDLSMFKPIEISATYDSHTFSSMGYVEVGNRWVKKDSVQEKTDIVRPTKISAESATLLLQDSDELKTRILVVERGPKTLHDVVEKVFRLQKDTSTDVGKLRITMTGIKQGGIPTFNKLIKQVDSLNSGVVSSNNDLAISV